MDKIVQQTFVSPAKIDFHKLDEDLHKQKTITATEQLVEQTIQTLDDIPPTRATTSQSVPPVGERLIKSKIIPDQARALAHALKHAVVKPLKKTMMPKKKISRCNSCY
jgi:hypothetical protein